ncbi:MAG: peroxidase-related enzyme [Geminicoccaceae bacterium]
MAKLPISSFTVPRLKDLPKDVRARIKLVQEKTGFVPNVFLVLARRPDEFRAFFAYYDALITRESGLSKAEKEMIVVATSAANQCTYCVVAHGALLRIFSNNPLLGDQVAINHRNADLSPRERAMLDAAMKLAREPQRFGEEDVLALLEHGFAREDVWDIGAITAFFALSNRMAHLSAMRPNDEFYAMGRTPRKTRG